MGKNGNLRFLLLELILADQLADLSPMTPSGQQWQFQIYTIRANISRSTSRSTPYPQEGYLVAKNGNLRFLLLQVLLADQLADLTLLPQ